MVSKILELEAEKAPMESGDALARAVYAQSQALTTLVGQIASAQSDPLGDLSQSSGGMGSKGALPRVKMAHGPFQATRIPPRLMQESSYCITSPRMRTWSCLPPGRGRRPADFFCRHVDQVSNCHLPPEPAFEARASGGKNVNVFL